MALGGGTYTSMTKILPGAYFQFVSTNTPAAALSERGVAAVGLALDWGVDGEIYTVEAADFAKNSLSIFGYTYDADEMRPLRDLFKYATKAHIYNLTGSGAKASNDYATAKYPGTRGNDLKIVIAADVDEPTKYVVATFLGAIKVDSQTVANAGELKPNAFVDFKNTTLSATAGEALAGGTNGTDSTTKHQTFLNKLEMFPDTNAVAYAGTDASVKALYAAFAKRVREDIGINLQAVVSGSSADTIAVVNVKNGADVVYWAAGVIAGTKVNASATNLKYNGEAAVSTDYTQRQLEQAITAGEWVLHKVGDDIRVLEDVNSLVTTTEELGEVFKDNQTVRIIDAIATTTASLFASKYIGKVPNDKSGRISLRADVIGIINELMNLRAVEDFDESDISVEIGNNKKSVVINSAVTIVNAMDKLYMRTVIE